MLINSRMMEKGQVEKLLKLTPHKSSFVKLNVNGAHESKGMSRCGSILRDNYGSWIGGFSKGIRCRSPLMAEFWSIFIGLKFVADRGWKKVKLESDFNIVITNIMRSNYKNMAARNLVLHIKDLRQILKQKRFVVCIEKLMVVSTCLLLKEKG
ncbi:unnamed protein product [Vicia faba]|uniref:RNase H type-1 domain-containing protein n=1 Tax=Vicia faba TaxID=3906 RepID=A0AAV0YRG6_VICFA|nr:unnamed protein product [Vicia faba]CAI8588287.1 unnamed protein product [Vicia faba]